MITRSRWWRRTRVLAAAGLVLGLGSLTTVAAFHDNTWANGQFAAIRGGIEGAMNSSDGVNGTWQNHFTTSTAAVMTVNPTANLIPGNTVYSKFSLRTSSGVTGSATVTMKLGAVTQNSGSTQAMVNAVRVRAYTSANHTCNATTAGQTGGVSYLLGSATPTYATANTTPVSSILLPAGTSTSAGPGRSVCFEFSLPAGVASDAANGADFSVTWPFTSIGT